MKVHYVINGSIPSDEKKFYITTYKFQKFGLNTKKYGWIAIDSYHGIGTGSDDFGKESEGEGLMQILNFLDLEDGRVKYLFTDNFEDVIEARYKMTEALEQILKQ